MSESTILTREQIRALYSPIRLDIMTSLRAYGDATAGEIAARVRIDEHLLYYHLRCLTKVDLVTIAGQRAGSTKPETIFSARAPGSTSELDMRDEATRNEVKRNVHTILKAAAREYCDATDIHFNDHRDDFLLVRRSASLSAEKRKEFIELVDKLTMLLNEQSEPGGEAFGLTLVMSPLSQTEKS